MRWQVALALPMVLAATACADGGGDVAGRSPDSAVTGSPGDRATGPKGSPHVVEPTPGLADVRPTAWQEAEQLADGRVRLTYWSSPCLALDRVETEIAEDRVVLTIYEGVEPTASSRPCVQIAELRAVLVEPTEAVGGRAIVDGADRGGSGSVPQPM